MQDQDELKIEKEPMIRMNIYLPASYKKWIEEQSAKTGMKQSSYVVMALKTYMDQQRTMELMPEMLRALSELKTEDVNSDETKKLLSQIARAMGA